MKIPYDSPQLDLILDALANQRRRYILHLLTLNPSTTSNLGRQTKLSLPAIHKHMRVLESSNLIIRRKLGRTNFVALNPKTLGLAQRWLDQYKTNWGSPDATLSNYIARLKE